MGRHNLTRRQFLVSTGSALALLATGCASLPGSKTHSIGYPALTGEKIQSPEHYGKSGCMTGIYTGACRSMEKAIESYERIAGKKPTYYLLPYHGLSHVATGISSTSLNQISQCASSGVIPFITYFAGDAVKSFADLDGIIAGAYDEKIRWAAKDLKSIGEEHGGFFIRTMEHMNTRWYANWGSPKNSKLFKDAWIKIWRIFDSTGTNRYATWVFNPYVPDPYGIAPRFYPGDQYVDWVGMSGFNMDGFDQISYSSINALFRAAYRRMFNKYVNKPIMICETGMHQLKYKPKWIAEVFSDVQTEYFGIKGLSWSSVRWMKNGTVFMDMRVDSSPEAVDAFKSSISDPYFLGTIPNRGSLNS
jgi:hypothetical protein